MRGARERLDVTRIGRGDLISVAGQQDQSSIDHVAAAGARQQLSRYAAERAIKWADLDGFQGPGQ